MTALSALGMPSSVVRPFQAALDARQAAAKRAEDPEKMLGQVAALRNSTAKRRDALKAEVEALKVELETKSRTLKGLDHDVEALQQQFAQLAATIAGIGASAKRGGEPPPAYLAVRRALAQTDVELSTLDYFAYKAATEAAGQPALCPLRWHLLQELRPLDAAHLEPPSKRVCLAGTSEDSMVDECR